MQAIGIVLLVLFGLAASWGFGSALLVEYYTYRDIRWYDRGRILRSVLAGAGGLTAIVLVMGLFFFAIVSASGVLS